MDRIGHTSAICECRSSSQTGSVSSKRASRLSGAPPVLLDTYEGNVYKFMLGKKEKGKRREIEQENEFGTSNKVHTSYMYLFPSISNKSRHIAS